jgi:Lon protease-like protein
MIPGATLADSIGERRIRMLETQIAVTQYKILELEWQKDTMEYEIDLLLEQQEADKLLAMVDRPDKGPLTAADWLGSTQMRGE